MMRGGKMMNTIIATQQLIFIGNSMEKKPIYWICVCFVGREIVWLWNEFRIHLSSMSCLSTVCVNVGENPWVSFLNTHKLFQILKKKCLIFFFVLFELSTGMSLGSIILIFHCTRWSSFATGWISSNKWLWVSLDSKGKNKWKKKFNPTNFFYVTIKS